jgi:hypothetical protein
VILDIAILQGLAGHHATPPVQLGINSGLRATFDE